MPDDDSQEEEATLTHQERAERAASLLFTDPPPSKPWVDQSGRIIAREMYPGELVEAAREELAECGFCRGGALAPDWDRAPYRAPDGSCDACKSLRDALSLYPEPEEENP